MAISRDAPQDISLIPSRLDDPTDREQSSIREGQEALQRLGRDLTWPDWPHVAAALQIGRRRAMHEAGVNRPVGHWR